MEKHLKVTKNQPQSSSSVSKPQIQILKNPNSKQANAQELQKQHVANATQFQTITQLNQAKKSQSPPKQLNKPSPNQNNFNIGNNLQTMTAKNAWNSPNQRTRLDFNNTTTTFNSNQKTSKQNTSSNYENYRNQTPNIGTGTGVPSSTMEQSPAPALVPIPFGLSTPTFQDSSLIPNNPLSSNSNQTKSTPNSLQTRNALLNSLFQSTEASHSVQQQLDFSTDNQKNQIKPDHLSALIQGLAKKQPVDTQFQKLNKISKLREILRTDIQIISYIESRSGSFKSLNMQNNEQDVIEHFKKVCANNDIKLEYAQFLMPEGYYGEIYLESFRLIKEQDKKRKRCCYFAYRNALLLLYGQSELAVRIAPNVKRDQNITLDIREGSGNGNQEVEFEYELYLVDSSDIFDNGPFQNKNNFFSLPPQKNEINNGISLYDLASHQDHHEPITLKAKFDFARQTSLPAELSSVELNPATDKESIFHLNTMLKSLILPQSTPAREEILEEDENDEDDADMTMNVDRKTRIREAIGSDFFILIPVNKVTGDVESIQERNSIAILNNSCQKHGFSLEFELKLKSSSNKQVISADQVESESEEGDSENENVKRKYKCKCLINRVKISSSHAKTKIDSKRQAAMKSLNYLKKIFPIVKDSGYNNSIYHPHAGEFHQSETSQSLPVQSSSTTPAARYFKISKDDLFKGLVPPTLFETTTADLNSDSNQVPLINSKLGTTNCF